MYVCVFSMQVFIHVFTDILDLVVRRVRVGIAISIEKSLQEAHADFNELEICPNDCCDLYK